ncbi:MAG TPA: hypothetical protein VMF32_14760 [Xanthobacteraceae bacterium]|nr:hypothetical protein [Xanthobacteraceae bacterium]
MALRITDRVWSFGELIDAALAGAGPDPRPEPPQAPADRRGKFRVIDGGLS